MTTSLTVLKQLHVSVFLRKGSNQTTEELDVVSPDIHEPGKGESAVKSRTTTTVAASAKLD